MRWDNEFGYRLALNGNVVKDFETLWDAGAKKRHPFSSTVPGLRGGRTISLQLMDQLGNGFEQQIPVELDDTDPTVVIDGPSGLVNRDAEFRIEAQDENLEKVTVLLDGRPVAVEVVAAGTHPAARYTEHRQGQIVATSPEGSPGATTTQLTVRLQDLPDLTSGRHTLSAAVFDATSLVPGHATELELSAIDSAGNTTRRTVTITVQIRLPGLPGSPGLPGGPGGGGNIQKPTKPVPPVRRPGLPRTGG